MTGLYVALGVLAAATVFGLVRRRRDGALRAGGKMDATVVGPADLDGAALGERATLLQFSTAFCAPCRATRRVLGEVAAMVDGVAHVELDAEHHLDLVRRLGVLRTPTVFVLDGTGRVVRRAAGQPRKADVIAALGTAIA
ncbi:TlpA family protein disulfide reductase [Actinomadura rayongensis]|uniref:Thioredoxin n=1 Tax=Actinomadura rayongensis TaxID=1429076 RepID=A0A6I4W957_9ACTN|nr:thioredoxin family protein [Actinomadura rayongensis]MXQ64805.1 thioredoxin [Actinomadura rayongensis]